jgi:hypothetical protein
LRNGVVDGEDFRAAELAGVHAQIDDFFETFAADYVFAGLELDGLAGDFPGVTWIVFVAEMAVAYEAFFAGDFDVQGEIGDIVCS